MERADACAPNMALTSWEGSVVRKKDIYTAKNYLSEDELDSLNRFVIVFLETAELRAKNRQDITTNFWVENIDKIIALNDKPLLKNKGSVSHKQMENKVDTLYEEFNAKRLIIDKEIADKQDMEELKQIENIIKNLK